jgi:hypothetical protein
MALRCLQKLTSPSSDGAFWGQRIEKICGDEKIRYVYQKEAWVLTFSDVAGAPIQVRGFPRKLLR